MNGLSRASVARLLGIDIAVGAKPTKRPKAASKVASGGQSPKAKRPIRLNRRRLS